MSYTKNSPIWADETGVGDGTVITAARLNHMEDGIEIGCESVVSSATVGDSTHIPVITYDVRGRITGTSTVAVTAQPSRAFTFFAS